jgi:hypothetical protein
MCVSSSRRSFSPAPPCNLSLPLSLSPYRGLTVRTLLFYTRRRSAQCTQRRSYPAFPFHAKRSDPNRSKHGNNDDGDVRRRRRRRRVTTVLLESQGGTRHVGKKRKKTLRGWAWSREQEERVCGATSSVCRRCCCVDGLTVCRCPFWLKWTDTTPNVARMRARQIAVGSGCAALRCAALRCVKKIWRCFIRGSAWRCRFPGFGQEKGIGRRQMLSIVDVHLSRRGSQYSSTPGEHTPPGCFVVDHTIKAPATYGTTGRTAAVYTQALVSSWLPLPPAGPERPTIRRANDRWDAAAVSHSLQEGATLS